MSDGVLDDDQLTSELDEGIHSIHVHAQRPWRYSLDDFIVFQALWLCNVTQRALDCRDQGAGLPLGLGLCRSLVQVRGGFGHA